MIAGIYTNSDNKNGAALLSELIEILSAAGFSIQCCSGFADVLGYPKISRGCDVIITLGGDGTILRAAPLAVELNAPIFGINFGRLGFLTEISPEDMRKSADKLLNGEYEIEHRMLLETSQPACGKNLLALNDVVLSRGDRERMVAIRTLVDDEELGSFLADGVVVSTPTGSTAYSLSAGGPLVSPELDCIIITPVCAHTLQSRPMVVPANKTVSLSLKDGEDDSGKGLRVSIDGQTGFNLMPGECLNIRAAKKRLSFIRLSKHRFFTLSRKKLAEWSR